MSKVNKRWWYTKLWWYWLDWTKEALVSFSIGVFVVGTAPVWVPPYLLKAVGDRVRGY